MSVQELQAEARNFDVEDVEYLRHGDKSLLMRLFKPHGAGPFPALVELHGGIWTENDRTRSIRITNGSPAMASPLRRSISARARPAIRTRRSTSTMPSAG